jgi:polyferredoxin
MSDVSIVPTRTRRRFPWRWTRRVVQLLSLAALLWLFRLTEYRGADRFSEPLNLIFRADPLVALSAMVGGRTLIASLWPAALLLVLTLIFARAFCGWICPVGTILDITHRLLWPVRKAISWATGRDPTQRRYPLLRSLRYSVLVTVLLAAAFSLPLVGYVDPFSLLYRTLAQFADPFLSDSLGKLTEADFRGTLLPFEQKHYLLAAVPAIVFGLLMLLEIVAQRFWCRYVCPLGGMLGLVGRFSPMSRVPVKQCRNCPAGVSCTATCRMDAFSSPSGRFQAEACTMCMDCVAHCPRGVADVGFRRVKPPIAPVDLSRRAAVTTLFAGIALPAVASGAGLTGPGKRHQHLLRPPGVGDDDSRFLDQCVRCGLCLKICPTNALQSQGLDGALQGLFSPMLVPRMGYCEVNCNLCSQVCPTAAIPAVAIEDKPRTIIGLALIDRDRCLPWANNEECICCEEHCPVFDKAIKVHGRWQRPHVERDLCIGCGICEKMCPVEGESAIRVVRLDQAPQDRTHRGAGRGEDHPEGGGGGQHRRRRGGHADD